VDQLNIMISEILNENKQQAVLLEDLFSGILSQLSSSKGSENVHLINECPDCKLMVNRVRFSRMIINIVNNSLAALPEEQGIVEIYVKKHTSVVCIEIKDNGCGIPNDLIDQIWEKGFSTKGSFGLGLTYIKSVVERHGGNIKMESTLDKGTQTTLSFQIV